LIANVLRTGPAGSTGSDVNRTQHRSGTKGGTASLLNHFRTAQNQYEPV
ncbi:hypothetical protein A2U01_0032556, partial [Trifolium medium]|nr:hypothetical protein [Trifolium medium]